MANLIDLDNLSPDLIDQLRAKLGIPETQSGMRSPIRKPLTDLRMPRTSKGRLNRPHFEWSADDDGNTEIPPFPRLYWDGHGVEMRVESAEDLLAKKQADWTDAPPMQGALTAADRARAEFLQLSADDQAIVLKAQKDARLARLHGVMSVLSDADIASFQTAGPVEVESKASKKAKAS